jgi:hypothetical protein
VKRWFWMLYARRVWALTLGTYVLAQVIVAAGALVRIPLLVDTLGPYGYGMFTTLVSVWPLFGVLLDGVQQAARAIGASKKPAFSGFYMTKLSTAAGTQAVGLLTLAGLGLSVVLVFAQKDLTVATWEIVASVAVTVGIVAIVLPFAPAKGALDASGRTAFSNLTLASNTIIGLPLLIIALSFSDNLVLAVAISTVGSSAPYIVSAVYVRATTLRNPPAKRYKWRIYGVNQFFPARTSKRTWSLIGAMSLWAGANVLAYGFATITVASVEGAEAAGAYTVAGRVMMIAIFLPIGLTGILTARFAKLRSTHSASDCLRWLLKATIAFSALALVLSGTGYLLGPIGADFLTGGSIEIPPELWIAQAAFAFVTTASSPFMSALTTSEGARLRGYVALAGGFATVVLSIPATFAIGVSGPVFTAVCVNLVVLGVLSARARSRPALLTGSARP